MVFMNENAIRKEIARAGYLVFVLLYDRRIGHTMSELSPINFQKFAAITQTLLLEKTTTI